VITRNTAKPLESRYGGPWQISWVQALDENRQPIPAAGLAALDKAVPPNACVGALLGNDSPTYLIAGRNFRRRVVYLSLGDAVEEAMRAHVSYVVIDSGQPDRVADGRFRADGWTIRELGGYWELAEDAPPTSTCN
jgi:hypothetical protein